METSTLYITFVVSATYLNEVTATPKRYTTMVIDTEIIRSLIALTQIGFPDNVISALPSAKTFHETLQQVVDLAVFECLEEAETLAKDDTVELKNSKSVEETTPFVNSGSLLLHTGIFKIPLREDIPSGFGVILVNTEAILSEDEIAKL